MIDSIPFSCVDVIITIISSFTWYVPLLHLVLPYYKSREESTHMHYTWWRSNLWNHLRESSLISKICSCMASIAKKYFVNRYFGIEVICVVYHIHSKRLGHHVVKHSKTSHDKKNLKQMHLILIQCQSFYKD